MSILATEIEQVRQQRIKDAVFHLRVAAQNLVAAEVRDVGNGRESPDALLMELADEIEREYVTEPAARASLAARVEEVW